MALCKPGSLRCKDLHSTDGPQRDGPFRRTCGLPPGKKKHQPSSMAKMGGKANNGCSNICRGTELWDFAAALHVDSRGIFLAAWRAMVFEGALFRLV